LQAVLFDMDGLLVDTEPLWTVAEVELLSRLGSRPWDDELKAAMIGKHIDPAVRLMHAWAGSDADPAESVRFLLHRMVELFADITAMPGAVELLRSVRAAGVRTALVSSSYRVLVDACLDQIGRDLFDVSVGGDEVPVSKPDPAPYRAAMHRLDVSPARCVVLEDSDTGARSGVAAGCVTVVVPGMAAVPPGPGRVLRDSLIDVDLPWLASLVSVPDRAGTAR
jgi:HAD superfamily hydrolase (TIGR01509 family)